MSEVYKDETGAWPTAREGSERAVTLSLDSGEYDIDEALSELAALCDTAGAEVLAQAVQKRERPDKGSFAGAGKLEERKELCESLEAELLVVDGELSGAQLRNIEDATDVRVIDRTTLILDIFARAAKSAEGKLQVELAQLAYRLPRLAGSRRELSRLGGGIGTRGPGESKLESDRRYIRSRMAALKARLELLEARRGETRRSREKRGVPVVALAGYTNVGKSSLLNALTGADATVENKLFATLDPTARRLSVGDLQNLILVDTVGFVSRLPHSLVEAFKSTLEEIKYADLILLVADAASPSRESQLKVARETLSSLGCADIPTITVYNKRDLAPSEPLPALAVSAKTGEGLDKLKAAISAALSERVVRCELRLPFEKAGLAALLRERGNVLKEEYKADGLYITATVERALYPRFEEYLLDRGSAEEQE
ncbi:MAG: GTPase HflX [Oscillospiraceae bacterium]|nr:GTPase HflX [Oscillospiraceae bacterium]